MPHERFRVSPAPLKALAPGSTRDSEPVAPPTRKPTRMTRVTHATVPITPIFIFSISRSGSTLLQRIIAAHDGVATTSEPWLLLPHAYTLRPRGVDAEYLHVGMVQAVEDFSSAARRRQRNRAAMHDFALRQQPSFWRRRPLLRGQVPALLSGGAGGHRSLSRRQVRLPLANPLSIVASIIETWGPWHPTMYRDDLFVGLPRLVAAYNAHREVAHAVRFEDLLTGDSAPWKALMAYLGLDFDPAALSAFADVRLNGRKGDPTGVLRYTELSSEPQQKWRATLANPLRKAWCSRYLKLLGPDRLATMGYDHDQLQSELRAQPTTLDALLPDVGRMVKDVAKEPLRVRTRNRRVGAPNVIRALLGA